jgi:alkylation response protein AidB-like acyl-CoA dehydrogenase
MNLQWSDEQILLRDMVQRFVRDDYRFEQRQKILGSAKGWSRQVWGQLAELGLTLLPFAEADGGLGGGGLEFMLVGEAFGRGLVVEPFLASVLLASTALTGATEIATRTALVEQLQAGEKLAAYVAAPGLSFADGKLSGIAVCVPGADAADVLLVAAQAAGRPVLVCVQASDAARDGYQLHGGGTAADLIFNATPATILASGNSVPALLAAAKAAGECYLMGEALGAAEAGFNLTVEYIKTRVQFGKPLGANQALQHRAAEMFVELEQLRSAALYAAVSRDDPDAIARDKALLAAKIVVQKSIRFIGQQIVQLHGGIGVTEEYAAGHYFMRLNAIAMFLGDAGADAAALAELGGFTGAAPYWETAT